MKTLNDVKKFITTSGFGDNISAEERDGTFFLKLKDRSLYVLVGVANETTYYQAIAFINGMLTYKDL
ncbi:hypothetical protein BH09PAT1_BH09PAT1_8150 [soil metagenome]